MVDGKAKRSSRGISDDSSRELNYPSLRKKRERLGHPPKDQRAPQRTATDKEKAEMREQQHGNCAHCDKSLDGEKGEAHHDPVRHSDGGTEMKLVHKGCHAGLHSCK